MLQNVKGWERDVKKIYILILTLKNKICNEEKIKKKTQNVVKPDICIYTNFYHCILNKYRGRKYYMQRTKRKKKEETTVTVAKM